MVGQLKATQREQKVKDFPKLFGIPATACSKPRANAPRQEVRALRITWEWASHTEQMEK